MLKLTIKLVLWVVAGAAVLSKAGSVAYAQTALPPAPTGVQVTREMGIEFSTIRAAGNAPHPAIYPFPDGVMDRPFGSVNYEYRLARTEVTTAQWLEFINTFAVQPDFPQELFGAQSFVTITGYPHSWGAALDTSYTGPGRSFRLRDEPGAAEFPVTGLSWRTMAMYSNWLHNGKSAAQSSVFDGAYDTSTFGSTPDGLTDQAQRKPDAKFWIPSYDEWTKGAFYDPDRYGSGEGGWWQTALQRDEPIVYGLPRIGEANAAAPFDPHSREYHVPLGAYPNSQSAWGILDAAGGTSEWTETLWDPVWADPMFRPTDRLIVGSSAGIDLASAVEWDRIGRFTSTSPYAGATDIGFRIAAAVPSPFTGSLVFIALLRTYGTRKRSVTS